MGSPGQMLYLSLYQNYLKKEDLHHERIQFDLKNEKAREKHAEYVSERLRELKRM